MFRDSQFLPSETIDSRQLDSGCFSFPRKFKNRFHLTVCQSCVKVAQTLVSISLTYIIMYVRILLHNI